MQQACPSSLCLCGRDSLPFPTRASSALDAPCVYVPRHYTAVSMVSLFPARPLSALQQRQAQPSHTLENGGSFHSLTTQPARFEMLLEGPSPLSLFRCLFVPVLLLCCFRLTTLCPAWLRMSDAPCSQPERKG